MELSLSVSKLLIKIDKNPQIKLSTGQNKIGFA